ncbi:inositol 1,4,5-triphosphate receptor associated 2 isoform X1 [Nerophis ophidion]|uniref:inositol 1,4,5-triphosphate receptor associated 2 isoform X1 n=2 Tax=Nerophis ophidion TaxID=159077 RepID=UPI002AE06885|nr:inositol 1,4,5-triphosphate receptor associated 2 isoform X1 [Nerophis ophidion]XP_061759497.1 inositol 1,4,5-triphosphate receptor associated 2 isoform X1 [Nerophis ophidion]XP_061759498.1 inositol 1,4,5-triphosphate receptor associated 2 isoform X1 [Nerophis ophidion]
MHPEPDGETNGRDEVTIFDSDDSDEESSQEEPPTPKWNELSIIERVGFNSGEMSETDLENSFSQIAMAFSCDQYTLKQRLQAEEHARNLAEDNIQLELSRGRETLEALKGLCLDSRRSKILQRLELSLDILAGTVERISNTAEVLGAVHQEARVSRAVELMVAHVDNVRRRLDRHEAELDEAKKMILLQNSCRSTVEPGAPLDPDDCDGWKKSFQQNGSRRRVSMSLIPSEILPVQKKGKRESKKRASHGEDKTSRKSSPACPSPTLSSESNCSAVTKEDNSPVEDRTHDPDENVSHVAAMVPSDALPHPTSTPIPECSVPPKPAAGTKAHDNRSTLDTTRHRNKSKASLSKKKTDKEKKRANIHRRISVNTNVSPWRRCWFHHCRWLLFCVCVLLSVITWISVLWMFHDDAPQP